MSLKLLTHASVLCCYLLNFTNGVDVRLSAEEKIELNGLFKLYNKPAVKEIKTIHGETFSCVDFYKQPAFDHPLLKNHSYHHNMKSSLSSPSQRTFENASQESSWTSNIWANGKGCPMRTVPIRKYTKKEFIRTHNLFQKLYPSDEPVPGRFRSSVHTLDGPHTFYGASTALNIYNYPIDASQYTAGYLILRAVEDQFQFGWMINPSMYGDGQTRLFLTTKVEKTKCFNLMCGGFVHVSKDVPLDLVLHPTTLRGDARGIEIVVKIVKDASTKQWRLYGRNDILVGFWPSEVLKGLSGAAEYLEWGGEAYNPPDKKLSGPGMGSGFFPEGHPELDGWARALTRYDESGAGSVIGNAETEMYSDNNDYYRVIDGGYFNDDFGHIAYYGGPGGKGA